MEAVAQETSHYREAFAALASERRGEPSWLSRRREEAFDRFQQLGFPTAKTEAWKYTNIAPIAERSWSPATGIGPRPVLREGTLAGWRIPGATELVFVNGRFSRDFSGTDSEGVHVESLAEILGREPEKVESLLDRISTREPTVFSSWNTAFFEDGVYVEIAPNAILTAPIHLVFVTIEEERAAVSSPRVLIVGGARSQATLVERYVGEGNATMLTNAVSEIYLRESATLDHYKLQEESFSTYHVQTVEVRQERGSVFTQHNLAIGGALARTDVNTLLAGEGAECTLNGLFVGTGRQHLDNHTFIDHASPHCSSRELYKGILDGKARGVFHGTILVRPGAQKTDAMQTNKNLLLSREALVDSTPALEILADDVKCRHGSTIGQLDANALFYLRSRGIDEQNARAMLTYAFAADVAARIRIPQIRSEIEQLLGLRYAQASPQGLAS